MNRKKVLIAITILTFVVILVIPVVVSTFLDRKISRTLNEQYSDYSFEIGKIHCKLIPLTLTFNKITISPSRNKSENITNLKGEIASVQLKGIKLFKALFKNKYEIDDLIISDSRLEGKIAFQNNKKKSPLSSVNIRIGNLLFDQISITLKDSASAQTFSIKQGNLNIVDLVIEKPNKTFNINKLHLNADQLLSVSSDSMYTYTANRIAYSDSSKTLSIEELKITPNYKGYDFTERNTLETDCMEAVFSQIFISDFPVINYFKSGNLISSSVAIGNMNLNVFRDKRKEDNQQKKPIFQEIIYNYPGYLHIDSILLYNGKIAYTEHGEKANEPGTVNFEELKARFYNVTNDSLYKTMDTTLQMKAEALLMGKSKIEVLIKAKLFDPQNTFSLNGTLMPIEVKELNSMLENNAFIYANSAKIDRLSFNFTANDTKATGQLILLYNGLNLAIKNKRTDDTTAIKEQFISFIANAVALDSNPLPGDQVRVGVIDYEREPTKFLFNYCLKSIVSGIKSTIIKNPEKKKTFLQKIFGSPKKK